MIKIDTWIEKMMSDMNIKIENGEYVNDSNSKGSNNDFIDYDKIADSVIEKLNNQNRSDEDNESEESEDE